MKVLAESPQCLVASPRLLQGRTLPLLPADLSSLPSMAWGPPRSIYDWHLEGPDGAKAKISHHPRLVTEDMVTLRLAALQGVGVVLMPRMVVRRDLSDGALVDVLSGWAPPTGIIHAVFPSRRGLLPSVRTLLDFIAAEYAALDRAAT